MILFAAANATSHAATLSGFHQGKMQKLVVVVVVVVVGRGNEENCLHLLNLFRAAN